MAVLEGKQDLEALKCELQACQRKLDSKCEALLILSKDLDQCRQERDQFQLMAEQVQSRYQSIKRQLAGIGPRMATFDGVDYFDMKHQSLAQLLCEMRDVNKSLQFEVDDLKQKLKDSNGDIKLLREQIARHRVGTTDEAIDVRHFPAYEREDLVHQLETVRNQFQQLERDLQQVMDEKEELVTERDVYRLKYDRLNKELHYILKGDERRVLDVDALIMENRYLQERIRQVEDERSHAFSTIAKYKSVLEKKKSKGILKLGQNRSGGVVVSQKQVHQLLESSNCMSPTPQMMADLQSLACALLESLNDKNVALSHQRKTNKILGTRVYELEKKLKTLEMTGLWNFTDHSTSLERLRLECQDIRTQVEQSTDVHGSAGDDARAESATDDDDDVTPAPRSSDTSAQCLADISPLPAAAAAAAADGDDDADDVVETDNQQQDLVDKRQAVSEAATSLCLLDLPVTEPAASTLSQDTDLLLASSSDVPHLSDQLLHYTDQPAQNGKDSVFSESAHTILTMERLPISDNGALMTFNSVELNEPAANTNHLVSDADRDLMSQLDDALAKYIDDASEAV